MCKVLAKEPFNKSFAEIGDMTPYQVREVLFRPDPPEGPGRPKQSLREAFWNYHRARHYDEDSILALWQKYQAGVPQPTPNPSAGGNLV